MALRILLIHHTPYHFEIAMSFAAQLGKRHDVTLWSSHLDMRGRHRFIDECNIKVHASDSRYDLCILITAEVPTTDIPTPISAMLKSLPTLRLRHDYDFKIAHGDVFMFPAAPYALPVTSIGLDFSIERPSLKNSACRLLIPGDVGDRRGYDQINNFWSAELDARLVILGGRPRNHVSSLGTLANDPRVTFLHELPETDFYKAAAACHFLMPLIDPTNFPRYFEAAFTTSILTGCSQSLPFIAHKRLFDLYPLVGLSYEDDEELRDCLKRATEMQSDEYENLVGQVRLRSSLSQEAFESNFERTIGQNGICISTFPFGTFSSIVWKNELDWDPVRRVISMPSAILAKALRSTLGWSQDSDLPEGTLEVPVERLAPFLKPSLNHVPVDEDWYVRRYLGGTVNDSTGKDHFTTRGFFDDLLPSNVKVDDDFYRSSYPDVANAIAEGWHRSSQAHFESNGYKEARRPYPGWLAWDCFRSQEPKAPDCEAESRAVSAPFTKFAKSPPPVSQWRATQEQDHLRKFFEHFSVDCVFDVGANAGQYARSLREEVGFLGAIVSFEPIPQLADKLRREAQSDVNWHIMELALDRTCRDTTFNVMEADQFSSLKSPRHSETNAFTTLNVVSRAIPVRTSTLAIELTKIKALFPFSRPFLKMDTQGNDIEIVEGCGAMISEFVGLQSELSISRLYEETRYFDDALRIYASKGFRLSALVPNNEGHFPDLHEIDCIMYRA